MDESAIIDELKAFSKREDWQNTIAGYAFAYARKIRKDYQQYLRDYEQGL
ncbi:hypothetical protein [Mucilaginibacter endophyticus]|nr:hypothetical protein [Mucilaginibacter endophyticus]